MLAILGGVHDEQARRAGRPLGELRIPGVLRVGEIDPLASLAAIAADPALRAEAEKIVDGECTQCGAALRVPFLTRLVCACDECREKAKEAEATSEHEAIWSRSNLCPPGSIFRATDPNHPSFPKSQYAATKGWFGQETLIFIGPSGTGKTRLAMHLLKRSLFLRDLSVGVLWPEDLKDFARSHDRREKLEVLRKVEVLLLDDPFLTGYVDERVGDFIKDVLDMRARDGKHHILTTQFGGEQYRDAFMAFIQRRESRATSADWARFDALFRRVRDDARTIVFGDVPANPPARAGEQATLEADF